jgi:PqqD family protein of HPr-rel-A system
MRKLDVLALNDEGFAFDPSSGDSFQVNSSGRAIIAGLRGEKSDAEIADSLVAEFDVETEDALADIADFRARLKSYGLLN